MKLSLFQVDAFADRLFSGNPAAVCPLENWLSDTMMQSIAAENNLAETAFIVRQGDVWHIRWFTPTIEVDLCGHATLASAFVIFHFLHHTGEVIDFHSPRSGALKVTRKEDQLTLDFPADSLQQVACTPELRACGQISPDEAFRGNSDYMLVFGREQDIRDYTPDFENIRRLPARGLIVTAPGNEVDFVSRFFAPQSGVAEDPVTGSAHTSLAVYWAERLDKPRMTAFQCSARGGYLECHLKTPRVEISGRCQLYLEGSIFLPDA